MSLTQPRVESGQKKKFSQLNPTQPMPTSMWIDLPTLAIKIEKMDKLKKINDPTA